MENAVSRVHTAANWSIVLSILMIVAGVLAIFLPMIAGIAITAVVGWLLLFSGILHLVFAWRSRSAGAIIAEILLGIVYGWIGLYLLTRPVLGLVSLTLAIAVYLLIEGILEFVQAFESRGAIGTGWLIFDGIVTLILAALIWSTWPANTSWVVGTLVGISMFFSGISRLVMSLAVRRMTA